MNTHIHDSARPNILFRRGEGILTSDAFSSRPASTHTDGHSTSGAAQPRAVALQANRPVHSLDGVHSATHSHLLASDPALGDRDEHAHVHTYMHRTCSSDGALHSYPRRVREA